jgi:hypothetical protein
MHLHVTRQGPQWPEEGQLVPNDQPQQPADSDAPARGSGRRARARWRLALTLDRNPGLAAFRVPGGPAARPGLAPPEVDQADSDEHFAASAAATAAAQPQPGVAAAESMALDQERSAGAGRGAGAEHLLDISLFASVAAYALPPAPEEPLTTLRPAGQFI